MRAVFLFIATIFCFSCGSDVSSSQKVYKQAIAHLHQQNLSAVNAQANLQVEGVGGAFLHDIKGLTYRFSTSDPLDLEEARTRMVSLVCSVLDSSNSDKAAQKYFHSYPLVTENLDLSIRSQPAIDYGSETDIALVMLAHGVIYYDVMPEPHSQYKQVHQETFEEAVRIVESEN